LSEGHKLRRTYWERKGKQKRRKSKREIIEERRWKRKKRGILSASFSQVLFSSFPYLRSLLIRASTWAPFPFSSVSSLTALEKLQLSFVILSQPMVSSLSHLTCLTDLTLVTTGAEYFESASRLQRVSSLNLSFTAFKDYLSLPLRVVYLDLTKSAVRDEVREVIERTGK
jgi:hypothetical protein